MNRGTKKSKPTKKTPIVGEDFKKAEQKRLEEFLDEMALTQKVVLIKYGREMVLDL